MTCLLALTAACVAAVDEASAQTPASAPGAGDRPRSPAAAPAAAASPAAGTTVTTDSAGNEVFRVSSGFDLDQYLFVSGSPLDFSIDVTRDLGPVNQNGQPLPGHKLYGRSVQLTLRVYDVDEDYAGGAVYPERDRLVVNGRLGPNPARDWFLSGANDQWSINTFRIPASYLRFPTTANPTGRNDFQIRIDEANAGSEVWAVEVDYAELRFGRPLPALMLHGITGSGASMGTFRDYVDDNVAGLGRSDVVNPDLTRNGSLTQNASIIGREADALLAATASSKLNVIAHSMGGLGARQWAFDHADQVHTLMMVGTPNGGSRLADILCGNRNISWWAKGLASAALDHFTRQFGECKGPQNGLYQLQESYVQDVFNPAFPDRNGIRYATIAGRGNSAGNLLLDGEDDGAVSVASVRYLRPDHPEHPGRHRVIEPQLDRDHSGLIESGSPALGLATCYAYPVANACAGGGGGGWRSSAAEPGPSAVAAVEEGMQSQIANASATIAPGGSTDMPVVPVADASDVTMLLIGAEEGVTAAVGELPFENDELLGVPVLAARPSVLDGTPVHVTNAGAAEVGVMLLVLGSTPRTLEVAASPTIAPQGEPVTVDVTLTNPQVVDVVHVEVLDATGSVVGTPAMTLIGPGVWRGTCTLTASGHFQLVAWVEGADGRGDSTTFAVTSDAVRFAGGFGEELVPNETGTGAAALRLSPSVETTEAGRYRVAGRLVDSSGNVVSTSGTIAELAAGPGYVELSFPATDLRRGGQSGPYELVDVVVTREEDGTAIVAAANTLGTTAAYELAEFEPLPVTIDPVAFSDDVVDDNADGTPELLRVRGAVEVPSDGSYAVNARLLGEADIEVARSQQTLFLVAGRNEIQVDFAWSDILAAGLDGPFSVTDLSVYDLGGTTGDQIVDAYRTAAYQVDPVIGARFSATPEFGAAPLDTTFDASASFAVGAEIVRYDWTFGDGSNGTGLTVQHRFATPGTYVVHLLVTDDQGRRAERTGLVTVTDVPPPVLAGDTATTVAGQAVSIDVLANDSGVDIDPATLSVLVPPVNGTAVVENGAIVYTPDAEFVGSDVFRYQVCGTSGLCGEASVTVQVVTAEQRSPDAVSDVVVVRARTTVRFDVLANDTDPDGDLDPASLAVVRDPRRGRASVSDGRIRYVAPRRPGVDLLKYRICDLGGRCDTATVWIVVLPQRR